ncbi:hypothetical protein BEL04_16835 [Mucilaginibacter sp. PPCGB 2223]|uniref:hypothetical protein n=1 Tax=Mucilaginibacter sp. PPCGB 2223 TaxID=1886027 RepID=UPI000826E2B2|nr:hypothetical protein [Mucilaginibacter sp. PPCGB 2223]OCX51682.1 hypothetical protein BEL04_16835 [Mucilaginibacter sp. PPCGB 2223]
MKSSIQRRLPDHQQIDPGNTRSKGISLPAVPALQRAAAAEEVPLQKKSKPVVQRVKVGDPSHSSIFLAVTHFPTDIYHTAKAVLDELKAAGTDFTDATAIVAAVNADARVVAARAGSVEISTLSDGKKLRQRHIDAGTWAEITPARDDHAYELTTVIDEITYKFHVHPPPFPGRDGIPGQIMKAGRMTNTQTSSATITAIFTKHGRPAGW